MAPIVALIWIEYAMYLIGVNNTREVSVDHGVLWDTLDVGSIDFVKLFHGSLGSDIEALHVASGC